MANVLLVDQVDGKNALVMRDVDPAQPGPGEVRYQVHAFGLNRADLLYLAGYHYTPTIIPSRVGFEACGIVDAVGAGVTGFKVGDRVTCLPIGKPAYSVAGEFAIMPENFLAPWPEHLSTEEATSAWMQYSTAYYPFCELAQVGAGDVVLITAASSSAGVGAIQLAKHLGATVIASSRTPAKADFLRQVGADHVVTHDRGSLSEQIAALPIGGRQLSMVYDAVAGPAIASYADALGLKAQVFIYGALSGELTIECPILPLIRPGASIHLYSLLNMFPEPGALQRVKDYLGPLIADGSLRPLVDRVFPFEEAFAAFAYLEAGDQKGKVVVRTRFAE